MKSKESLGRVLDVGCGIELTALLLKLYLGNVEYLVNVDISAEKIRKASKLNLYDELHVTDIRNFEPETKFDTVMALEILHGLPADVLLSIRNLCKQNGSVIMALPSLPNGVNGVWDKINQCIKDGFPEFLLNTS